MPYIFCLMIEGSKVLGKLLSIGKKMNTIAIP